MSCGYHNYLRAHQSHDYLIKVLLSLSSTRTLKIGFFPMSFVVNIPKKGKIKILNINSSSNFNDNNSFIACLSPLRKRQKIWKLDRRLRRDVPTGFQYLFFTSTLLSFSMKITVKIYQHF